MSYRTRIRGRDYMCEPVGDTVLAIEAFPISALAALAANEGSAASDSTAPAAEFNVSAVASPANPLIARAALPSSLQSPISALAGLAINEVSYQRDEQPNALERAYRLSRDQADTAHAQAWDDAVIVRFQRRLTLLLQRGLDATEADDLAERLHLRDVDRDDSRCCFECMKCRTNRCAAGEVFLGAQLQRCPQFKAQIP